MTPEGMRLQKFLSRAGVASRREAETLMTLGRVTVNGTSATQLGIRVDPSTDRIEVDGERVRLAPARWIMLNKPAGTITSRRDPEGRLTVYALLADPDRSLRYVGRLDRETEGLLLFTNEGDLHHALTHPSIGVEREYEAVVDGVPSRETIEALEGGVELEDGVARAERVRTVGEPSARQGSGSVVSLVMREGRKREVRRLLYAVGHPVRRLTRIRFGPLSLGDMSAGTWRELSRGEIEALREAAFPQASGEPVSRSGEECAGPE